MTRAWIDRRYVEADWRLQEARYGLRWWDSRRIMRRYRIREFWKRMGGQG